jgi:hypothetical protein
MPVVLIPQTYKVNGVNFSQEDVDTLSAFFPQYTSLTTEKETVRNTSALQKAILAEVCLNNGVNNNSDMVTLYLSPDGCELLNLLYTSAPPDIPTPVLSPQDIVYLNQTFVTDMAVVPQSTVRASITLNKALQLEYVVSNLVNPTAPTAILNLSQAGRAFLGRV